LNTSRERDRLKSRLGEAGQSNTSPAGGRGRRSAAATGEGGASEIADLV